jgi:carboxyl-terminal processing protease
LNLAEGAADLTPGDRGVDAGKPGAGADEPIYKRKRMPTVLLMFKRILILASGVALGFGLTLGAAHFSQAWGLFPNRDLSRSMEYMRDVVQMVNQNYVDGPNASYDKLAKTALHGMVESLDPHSEFLESRQYDELEEQLSGDFTGIGIQVEMRHGHVVVIAPIANSPSERAGIRRGDEIISVDGKGVEKNVPMDAIVERLRGKPRTKVAVEFFRPSTARKFQLTLLRETIKLDTVRSVRVLNGHTGYILLTEFSEHTGEEFDKALDQLLKEGIDSLVIDMRNNPGGLLDAAVAVAEPFFRHGELIVYTQGRKPADTENLRAEAEGEPLQIPLAVLINASTASAAEVVTGALKDTHRAVVVGERSFGKGSVQSIFQLKNGEGLRLTTARYFTPSGVSIHEKGIAPNVEVVLTQDEDSKLRVQQTRDDISDAAAFKERFGFTPIEDRQLAAALDVLRGIKLLDERSAVAAVH